MTRALVGYATRGGSTADVAEILAAELRAGGWEVDVANVKDQPSPEGYDLVVVGSGINAMQWFSEAIAWVARNAVVLGERPVAVFNVCLNAADPAKRTEALGYNQAIHTRIRPMAEASFAGRYTPARVGFWQRLFLRTLIKPPQDHVDPQAIGTWARELTARMSA